MALALRLIGRGCGAGRPAVSLQGPLATIWTRTVTTTSTVCAMKVQTAEDFWVKNKRLRRPVSPHLTIYKPQVTSLLSLAHRASGIVLSSALAGFSIGMLALPGSYPYYLDLIQSMQFGGTIIFGAKFLLALPVMFHVCNGVRHLMWDIGYGFTLRTLYKTGYLVVGLSVVLAGLVAAM